METASDRLSVGNTVKHFKCDIYLKNKLQKNIDFKKYNTGGLIWTFMHILKYKIYL